jgi:hypothetical protein
MEQPSKFKDKLEDAEISELLKKARDLVGSERPFQALELVIDAIRKTKGEESILPMLAEAKSKVKKNEMLTVDEMNLFKASLEGERMKKNFKKGGVKKKKKNLTHKKTKHTPPTLSFPFFKIIINNKKKKKTNKRRNNQLFVRFISGKENKEVPIICELGKEDILHDAYADGSSLLCERCGALVKATRMEAHRTMWCDALPED